MNRIRRSHRVLGGTLLALAGTGLGFLTGCGGASEEPAAQTPKPSATATSATTSASAIDGVIQIEDGRGLHLRCTGAGAPTVVLEGGDDDTSDSYSYAEGQLAKVARTCVYDRANLGRSDPAPGPRQLDDYVGDLEKLFAAARVEPPYVLVGTSGGGYLVVGYAARHHGDVAGMVLIDTGKPLDNPPKEIVEATDPENSENVEKRDYLQIERDAWGARRRIGDIPVSVISVEFSAAEIKESPFPVERAAMRANVTRQQGWLVLSPRAKQIVTHGGHAVEEANPTLVVETILYVVRQARRS